MRAMPVGLISSGLATGFLRRELSAGAGATARFTQHSHRKSIPE